MTTIAQMYERVEQEWARIREAAAGPKPTATKPLREMSPEEVKAFIADNDAWRRRCPNSMTADEAVRAAKRLYRFALGSTYSGEVQVTSGNRETWMRHGRVVVNPGQGWHTVLHNLSHAFWYHLHPGTKPHCKAHARLELRMLKEAVKRGWLDGSLLPAPRPVTTKAEVQRRKLEAIERRLAKWESKAKRAATAIRKCERERRAMQRRLDKEGQE